MAAEPGRATRGAAALDVVRERFVESHPSRAADAAESHGNAIRMNDTDESGTDDRTDDRRGTP